MERRKDALNSNPYPTKTKPSAKQLEQKPKKKGRTFVSIACTECRRLHKSCSVERPCLRCVSLGHPERCKDVARRKRGKALDSGSPDVGLDIDEVTSIATTSVVSKTTLLPTSTTSLPSTNGSTSAFSSITSFRRPVPVRWVPPHQILLQQQQEQQQQQQQQHQTLIHSNKQRHNNSANGSPSPLIRDQSSTAQHNSSVYRDSNFTTTASSFQQYAKQPKFTTDSQPQYFAPYVLHNSYKGNTAEVNEAKQPNESSLAWLPAINGDENAKQSPRVARTLIDIKSLIN